MINKKNLFDFYLTAKPSRYAQTKEEAVLCYIFEQIGTTNKYCVEFGAGEDGDFFSNTKHFINLGWSALLMDANGNEINVEKEFITAENINELFEKYSVPSKFDLLSLDIDGFDFYVWQALINYEPRVVIIEMNCFAPDNKVIKYNPKHFYNKTKPLYHGASFGALKKLGESKGYELVCNVCGLNLIFVKKELVEESDFEIKHQPPQQTDILEQGEWVDF